MRETDLGAVHEITNAAFRELVEHTTGRRVDAILFAENMGRYRLHLDPAGCHVAIKEGQLVGANFSVLRGTLGWFGPLAVRPDAQGHGIAQRLVNECLRSFEYRGARLIGLETLASSPQHIHLYQKLGFRPSWTGIGYRGEVSRVQMPANVTIDADAPPLDYVYRGYDASGDAVTTRAEQVGVTLRAGAGFAVCHVVPTLWAEPTITYVPLIAAPDREIFASLLRAIDAVSSEHGKVQVITQAPGSAWATQDALIEHGYKPGGAALRMKRGERLDYDAGSFFYCDDWH